MSKRRQKPKIRGHLATKDLKRGGQRLKTRRVDEQAEALQLLKDSMNLDEPLLNVIHGGAVSDWYPYPCETEAVITVAFPSGYFYQWGVRVPAKDVERSKILATCFGRWAGVVSKSLNDPELAKVHQQIIQKAINALRRLYPDFTH